MGFEPGQRIGDYEIVAKLGAGGLGIVYEVRHIISQRREAVKILLPDQCAAPEMVQRFQREVQTLATLCHPNIAQLHTAFYFEDQLVMAMELIEGQTLRDFKFHTAITLRDALNIIRQVLDALVYAHTRGVVHRDIKPSNIMLTDSGVVKLLDFGLAMTDQGSDLTLTGHVMGTINYMSPEQVKGAKASASSDIYAVGVMLYELITGALPLAGASNYEIMQAHVQRVPVAPHILVPGIPLSISQAAMRALEKDPVRRFASAREFLAALQAEPLAGGHLAATAFTQQLPTAAGNRTRNGSLSSGAQGSAALSSGPKLPSSSGLQNPTLEDLTRRLAVHIGPVAKFVVKKLAAQTDDMEVIFREAAKQIPSDTERTAFLRSKGR